MGRKGKYKSRLVAGGHKEVLPFWVDTSSPTVRFETLLICFCIAAHLGLEMSTGDVGGAFLEALMDRPDVFVRLDKEVASVLIKKYQEYKKYKKTDGSIVVNLKKAMYGLKEASMRFYQHFTTILMDLGFKKCSYDLALLYKVHKDGSIQLVALHVDDFSAFGKREHNEELCRQLQRKFKTVNIEQQSDIYQYLGMVVHRSRDGKSFRLSQPGYIEKMIEEFALQESEVASVPYGPSLFECGEDKEEVYEPSLFKRRLMMLAFLCRTRPDIKLPISYLATKMQKPSHKDHLKLRRIAKYIQSTKSLCTVLRPDKLQLFCSADASYNIHCDAKGHSGVVIWLGHQNAPIHAASRKQAMIAKSSTEAEMLALSEAGEELLWAKNLLEELGFKQEPIQIEQDNTSTIRVITRGPGRVGKTKHMNKHRFWIKEHIDNKDFDLVWFPSLYMVADGFTKALTEEDFKWWRRQILNED